MALLVVASMFIGVCYHAYGTYAEIHTGRKTWGQFGLTVAIGAVLLVIGIWLLTEATGIPGEAGMSEQQHVRADGTVTFLPHRLNRHPVVVRGLTADEPWICCGLSGAAGLAGRRAVVLDVPHDRLAPTFVVLGVAWASSSAAASCGASSAGAPTPGCTGNCNGASPRAIR